MEDQKQEVSEEEVKNESAKADEPQTQETTEETDVDEEKPEDPKQDKKFKSHRWQSFLGWYKTHKKISIPLTVVFLFVIIGAVPWSRYHTVGLVYKKDFVIQAVDSTANTPVSGATISAGSIQATTDANGKATLHLAVGQHTFLFSKKYYQGRQASAVVPILSEKKTPSIPMQATGRQVKITIKNVITQKTLAGVSINIADINAKTDDSGSATVVLPVGAASQKATLTLDGYNDASVTVQVSNTEIKQNDFTLTPAGKVYFLSNSSGKIDVMKSDLDGKNPQVVLAGTGYEGNTVGLFGSADWKYIALLAKRSPSDSGPQVYVISASDDKLLTVDSGNADFGITGWLGDSLIYTVGRNEIYPWQTNKYRLKSYDATSGKITLLDQTTAAGDSTNYAYEYYSNVIISGSAIVYSKDWLYVSDKTLLSGKQDTISEISADGSNHKVAMSNDAATNTMSYAQHSPNAVYVWRNAADPVNTQFLDYTVGSLPKQITLTQDQFYQRYPTYYWTLSGKQAFWSEIRDGKNTLMVGDNTGANAKTILSQSDYAPFGWFSDQYLLVNKGGNELYIMPVAGGTPLKISNYQQAAWGV